MNAEPETSSLPTLPSIFEWFPRVATIPRRATVPRRVAFWSSLAVVPAAVGVVLGIGSRRRGLIGGGLAALALGAVRLQLARWFTDEPAFVREGTIGELELRRYPARVEATTSNDEHELEAALDAGYGRLACYIDGVNDEDVKLPMSAPVITAMREGRYTTSFIMPANRPFIDLPVPDDERVELREVPERLYGVLRFHGTFTSTNIARHEKKLLQALVDAGLSARGSVMFAAFDHPATLPLLRRNELWIEIV